MNGVAMTLEIGGLGCLEGFVEKNEEAGLLERIDTEPWRTELRRRVQHYGYRYDYRARSALESDRIGPLPEWLDPVCRRLVEQGIFGRPPDQAIVNEYLPGQGISAHIDCVPCFGDVVASLSLGSAVTMRLSHPKSGESRDIRLAPRSLLVLSGEARYEWRHGIPARKSDLWEGARIQRGRRVSLTFRTMAFD
jgi:alkylated DNA repair dioxygenase AlkB